MRLEPAHHPLADVINNNKGKIDFCRMQLHPFLPFAILYGGRHGSTFVTWGESRDHGPRLLCSSVDHFSFSPDGKWVVFKYERGDTPKTFLMPVSEKYPFYLGSPMLLGSELGENNRAWTTNPVSFVGSYLDKIYRWGLTNEGHPESDRATFHDYVVEHDLEKLTKEKRQGLGEKRQ